MDKLRVGIVGSKFAASLHAECYRRNDKVQMVAVAALDEVEPFAARFDIPHPYEDYLRVSGNSVCPCFARSSASPLATLLARRAGSGTRSLGE